MSGVKELLEELEQHTAKLRDELGHLVSWQKFERAGAVVTELAQELEGLGLPLAPVESLTQAVLAVAQAVHDHLTVAQTEQEREGIEAQIAELQAKLGTGTVPPAGPTDPLFKEPITPPAPPAEPDPGTGGK